MNISSPIRTDDSISAYYRLLQSAQSKTTDESNEKKTTLDTFSLSNESIRRAKMPPPPEAVNFESMSDDDFKSYLEQCSNTFGSLPGIDNASSINDLTEEQLAQLRQTFTEMSQNGPGRPGGPGGAPQLSQLLESADETELKSILTKLFEKTGSISGLEDEDLTSIDDLTQEQLDKAKEALIEDTKKREEEMHQRQALYTSVISAYEKNLAVY